MNSRLMYRLDLVSEGDEYKGVLYVDRDVYDGVGLGNLFGDYSIVTCKNGSVRFSKVSSQEGAITDISNRAKNITMQSLTVILLFGIPSVLYLIKMISLFC